MFESPVAFVMSAHLVDFVQKWLDFKDFIFLVWDADQVTIIYWLWMSSPRLSFMDTCFVYASAIFQIIDLWMLMILSVQMLASFIWKKQSCLWPASYISSSIASVFGVWIRMSNVDTVVDIVYNVV